MANDTGNGTILKSEWGNLSPFLIAIFYPCDEKGIRLPDSMEVQAPLTDTNFEMTFNWQSPFEAASPDTKAPAIAGLIQSGALAAVYADLNSPSAKPNGGDSATAGSTTGAVTPGITPAADQQLNQLKGRTGITKLNSIQIFTGMAPVKFSVAVRFRAMADAYKEVEVPVEQLRQWAVPIEISSESIVARAFKARNVSGFLDALLPSRAPTMIGFQWKNKNYGPLVIEGYSESLDHPINWKGDATEKVIQLSIASLTALDRKDFTNMSIRRT